MIRLEILYRGKLLAFRVPEHNAWVIRDYYEQLEDAQTEEKDPWKGRIYCTKVSKFRIIWNNICSIMGYPMWIGLWIIISVWYKYSKQRKLDNL